MEVKEEKKEKKGHPLFLPVSLKGGGPTGFRRARNRNKFSHLPSTQTCRCDWALRKEHWGRRWEQPTWSCFAWNRVDFGCKYVWGISMTQVNNNPLPGLLLLILGKSHVTQRLRREWGWSWEPGCSPWCQDLKKHQHPPPPSVKATGYLGEILTLYPAFLAPRWTLFNWRKSVGLG